MTRRSDAHALAVAIEEYYAAALDAELYPKVGEAYAEQLKRRGAADDALRSAFYRATGLQLVRTKGREAWRLRESRPPKGRE